MQNWVGGGSCDRALRYVTLHFFFRFFIAWAESDEITLLAFSVYDKKNNF